jgi:hypothetical protein
MVGGDVVTAIAPQLLDGPDAIAPWIQRFTRYAEAMIESERQARISKAQP